MSRMPGFAMIKSGRCAGSRLVMMAAFGLLVLWLAGYVLFSMQILYMKAPGHDHRTDAIIVLTGGSKRIEAGLALLESGQARELFISGVNPDVHISDLAARRGYRPEELEQDCCITLGYNAADTIGNAREAHEWVRKHKVGTLRLVTSNYHMHRALAEFRARMPGIQIMPHPVQPEDLTWREPAFWSLAFREYHKYIASRLRITLGL